MPTPMHVYSEIAARYGVDPKDENTVDEFYKTGYEKLSQEVQMGIADELIARDGESLLTDKHSE